MSFVGIITALVSLHHGFCHHRLGYWHDGYPQHGFLAPPSAACPGAVELHSSRLFSCLDEIEREERKASRSKPQRRTRSSWYSWSSVINDTIFRRMFRMPRDSFDTLCDMIENSVGKDIFKSESWLAERVLPPTNAAMDAVGGFVSGQFKLALMLRILAGASYLDLLLQYDISTASVYKFFHEAIAWINDTFDFPLKQWLENENWDALHRVSDLFAAASGDAFKGCIGALDGLAIKIKCPTLCNLIPDG